MAINHKELAKLAKFARKNGITAIKVDGIELQFHAAALFSDNRKDDYAATPDVPMTPQYTEDEILNWSSTGIGAN